MGCTRMNGLRPFVMSGSNTWVNMPLGGAPKPWLGGGFGGGRAGGWVDWWASG